MDEIKWEAIQSGNLESLADALLSSSTSRRVRALQVVREKNGTILFGEARISLLDVLFRTYPFYIDRLSRQAVQQCLRAVLNSAADYKDIKYFTSRLQKECSKPSLAPASAFVLVEWCCLVLQHLSSADVPIAVVLDILSANANVLELCLAETSKPAVQQSALRVTRRALRAVFSSHTFGEETVRQSISRLTVGSAAQRNAPFIGVICGVCARLPEVSDTLEDSKKQILNFYTKEVVGSRTIVPSHIANGLSDFFSSFVTYDDLVNEVIPTLEKAILRSPEVVLNGLIPPLSSSLPASIDLSAVINSRLAKPLLSSLKSTNAVIRQGAAESLESLISRCKTEDSLLKLTNEIIGPLKTQKISNAEQRALHADAISAIPCFTAISQEIIGGLVPVAVKESSEVSLAAELKALCKHLAHVVCSKVSLKDELVTAIAKALIDKRAPFRKLWQLQIAEVFWATDADALLDPSNAKLINQVLTKLKDSFNEVVANPLPSAQNGLVATAYGYVALCSLLRGSKSISKAEWESVTKQSMSLAPKPSFLLNTKVYSKLTTKEEFNWCTRALAAIAKDYGLNEFDAASKTAWGQAFISMVVSPAVSSKEREESCKALTAICLEDPKINGGAIIDALWSWILGLAVADKESAANAAGQASQGLLHFVAKAIFPNALPAESSPTEIRAAIEDQLIRLLILCREELIPKSSWIDICLKTGTDPGKLVSDHADECVKQLMQVLEDPVQSKIPQASNAVGSAAADLVFVAPDVMIPRVAQILKEDLASDRISRFTPTDAAIARTLEGTTFIDVLNTKSSSALSDKNIKDYDTLKWEEELRQQLAQKKGQPQKKLTADDQAKVKAQLAKEAKIRDEVVSEVKRIERGCVIVRGLATGPPTDPSGWMSIATTALLSLARLNAGLFVGDAVSNAYISCAERVSTRLGPLRPFIGIATLRALGNTNLSPEMEVEPLGDLVTRILYRLRFSSEQLPFESASLAYILPLAILVLSRDGIEEQKGEEGGEQVLLTLEFLSFHSSSFADSRLNRGEVLQQLITSLHKYSQHYKIVKDTLLDFCRCISSNITHQELDVLFEGSIAPEVSVRTAVLQAIEAEIDLTDFDFSEHIWLCCHDQVEENAELAEAIWEDNALDVDEDSYLKLLKYLESKDAQLRGAASRALAHVVELNPSIFGAVLSELQSRYIEEVKPKAPGKDRYGMPLKADTTDVWEIRSGVALTFKAMTNLFEGNTIVSFMKFLIENGPLVDKNSYVREQMADSGRSVIAERGEQKVEELMTLFEKTLESSDKATASSDWLNEAVIVLYGSLARHLKPGDVRLSVVVNKLLAALPTPSEMVQSAVAECLPPLVRLSGPETETYVRDLLDQLIQSKKYATRRGAAYGIAGIIHGKGILALRQYRIMPVLRDALDNKKDPNQRQGALLAYELLSAVLGRTFEPYVIQIVPHLLTSFGDPSVDVREACLDAAKACFANLSSYGVKQILPTLLEGLDDPQWRSKKGACDLLGAMAYLDPQQLAASLPDIIPPLTVVLNDSHKEVRNAANRSLQRFGEVISNPEVKGLVGILLKALSDPTKYTDEALDSLIKVSFVHYLDAPSLALVVRILERGLGDRSATKRKAAEIIGSLAHLTERKDLISHLPILVSGLRLAIVDPVPTTRATASKALGSLIEKLGEDALPDLIPSLMSTLKSDTGAGDRLGSAQALSEVLAGLGTTRLEETLPTILQNVSSSKPSVREGFMSLFIFLPACFGNSFASYLSKIIPPILAGLADDIETIRETSLRAGRLLVKNFSSKAIDLLLPELERGLADDSHRIRLSSVELVGDLLFNITGITNKVDAEEQEEGATQAGQSLLEILGEEKRNKILSALYICRCDTSGLVRSAAVTVWKALVATPRTLKELVPTLTQFIIRRLGSSNMEQKVIAGNALGDLIKKAGESVLATLLPSLEDGLRTSTDVDAKQGICIALRELIVSASAEALEDFEKILISIVRVALVDNDEDVREAAAEAFDALQQSLGKKAVDQVLPYLLSLLRNEDEAEQALSALLTLLTETTRANIILPNLIPTLLTAPISTFNARALASLAEVASSAMTRRLPTMLNTLMDEIISTKDEEHRLEISSSFDTILVSVDEYDGLNVAMSVMLGLMKHDDHRRRANAANHLAKFFSDAEIDYSRYHQDLIRVLLISFDDRDVNVVKAAWAALSKLTSNMRKEEMELLVVSSRQTLRQVGVPGAALPGFSLPKGIMAIFPIFLQGLLNGNTEQRTQSALAIADIIDRTAADSLKPFVTQITGPLIRVVSERSVDIKSAVFFALNKLLEKIPLAVKPFLPQLQRTFARGLADTTSDTLRNRAAKGLGILITLTPRVDPLVAELITGSKTDDNGVKNAMMKALHEVVSKAGGSMSETSRNAVLGLIDDDSSDRTDAMAITNAQLLGALVKNLTAAAAIPLIRTRVLTTNYTHASILGLNALLVEAPELLLENFATEIPSVICQGLSHTDTFISDNSVLAAGKYILAEGDGKNFESTKPVFVALASVIPPGNPADTRRLALVVIRTISRLHPEYTRPHLVQLIPPIFGSVRDTIIPVKLAAEAAFLAIFDVVESEGAVFDRYMAGPGAELPPGPKRSMSDYFKRVALRLASQARERREAEGGQGGLGLSNDEVEDEKELWSIGKVDLGDDTFGEE
ncbi:putative translational activator [Talaromyces proteolyticus]|uniref:eIF-2-alpha kinase activator GCN1 n=1 Tax=Talaromyces proteolyticus TaxID=1131652 RepID=A0AAD4KS82_9EURO|nr:putative translational activator [Talaromyces proteolyticus]KAH8695955.1 putative translational activator [Talaromyces proteolyticus]